MNIKTIAKSPSHRADAVTELTTKLAAMFQTHIDNATKTCLNCEHFFEKDELCRFNGINQRPPARVIVTGCPAHQDEIPF